MIAGTCAFSVVCRMNFLPHLLQYKTSVPLGPAGQWPSLWSFKLLTVLNSCLQLLQVLYIGSTEGLLQLFACWLSLSLLQTAYCRSYIYVNTFQLGAHYCNVCSEV
jgi:hypothetical protein